MNEHNTYTKRDHVSVFIFLLLFPLVILIFDFSFKQIPGNYTSLYNNPLWIEGKSIPPVNTSTDIVTDCTEFLSDYLYICEVKSFSSLLWDNSSGGGTPFLARWESRPFSLFSVPFYLLPLWQSIYVSTWLKMVMGGIGVYLLAMSLGLLPSIGLFLAVLFQVSSPLFFMPIHPITDIMVWFPLYLCLVNYVIYRSSRYWILLCPVIVLMLLGGNIEMLTIVLGFTLLYLIITQLINKPNETPLYIPPFFIILSWIIAGGFVAFQIFPFIEWLQYRALSSPPSEYPFTISYKDLIGLFFPASISKEHNALASLILMSSPGICCIFFLPLWLGARSLIPVEKRNKIESFFITSLLLYIVFWVITCWNIHIPYLPNLNLIHVGWLFLLSVGIIIGMAVEAWNVFTPDECRICINRLLFLAPLVWGVYFVIIFGGKMADITGTELFWKELGFIFLIFILIVLYLFISLFKPSPRNSGYILTLILLLSVVLIYLPYRITTPVELLKLKETTINKLKEHGTRFVEPVCLQNSLFPYNGINMMIIPSKKSTERYTLFMQRALEDPKLWFRAGASSFLSTWLDCNNANNSFYKIRSDVMLADILSSGMAVFKLDRNISRAYVIFNGKTTNEKNPELLSSDLPHLVENAPIPENTSVSELPAIVEDISSTHVRVKVEKTKPGILVLADTYYPGWSVTVDNVAKDIIPVNIAFRGVELSEGDHLIDFTYQSNAFWWGTITSITTFLIYLMLIQFTSQFSRRIL